MRDSSLTIASSQPATLSSISPYLQSLENRVRGVGCGYVVEINLDKIMSECDSVGGVGGIRPMIVSQMMMGHY